MNKLQVGDTFRVKPSALDGLRVYVPECIVDDVVVVHDIKGTWVDLLFLRLGIVDNAYFQGWVMKHLEKVDD